MMTVGSMVFETEDPVAYSRALRALRAGGATITYNGREKYKVRKENRSVEVDGFRIDFTPCEGFDHVTRHPCTPEEQKAYDAVARQSIERGLPPAGGWTYSPEKGKPKEK